ncbi:[citrate (pro-3S)-lyase] ligase [Pseudoflavonifractor sp. 60]|uniref:[citrate (pro-3S)-lyase] ligase n=1 Tax=Pseudoflavonifractor sp. 60 TaxID=2304576 RepID=UPI00136D6125|nr:[citrate (pro-3S)-lyase] ligase [Pseudoflavonifractor sp. 60]NBI68563.1 [citrate (pro-3S)-lyase] ligase [Pseudoflavonifractor sp. 60]
MREEYHVTQLQLRDPRERERLTAFLLENHLTYEDNIQTAFAVLDENDTLSACGCAAGPLLKCFAVTPELRGQNALGPLVSALVQERFAAGFYELFLITRSCNEGMFSNCGFFPVVRTQQLVLLENRMNGLQVFTAPMGGPEDVGKTVGAVVMNCNPFTLGHQALVEFAASQCDILHLFVVEEDRSCFPTHVRLRLVQEGTAHLPNVRVHLSGHYMISLATFPTYFLKEGEDAAALQSALDITLFAQCIAPELHITKRFAGQEPLDPTTNCYNQTMKGILPQFGIECCEIPRICSGNEVISASRVRRLLREKGLCQEVLALVPETTGRYLQTEFKRIQ